LLVSERYIAYPRGKSRRVAISLEYNHTSLATLNYHIALLRNPKPHSGIASIYQPDSLVDAATAAISLIESEVFDCIEVDTGI
jgi:hypothetical protein